MRTLVTAAVVLAHYAGRHALLSDGAVVYEDDRIVQVGPAVAHRDGSSGQVDEVVDLGESVLLPGLIDLDALTDIDHLLLDSWHDGAGADALVWSEEYARAPRAVFDAEQRRQVREYALVQLALHGVTTFMPIASEVHSDWAESCDDLVAFAQVSRQIGLRGYLGPSYRSGVNVVRADGTRGVHQDVDRGRAGLAEAVAFLDHCDELDDPLVTGVLLPCRIETLDADLMRATAEVSARRDTLVRLHALQGLLERRLLAERDGLSPLDLLEETGLLNDRLLLPHAVFTDQSSRLPAAEQRRDGAASADLARLAAAGTSVVHCPLTSLRYGMVLESFGRYRAAGVNLALGTDSFPPDLIRGMDVGVQLAKWVDGRHDAAPVEQYVEAATLGGARALRRPDLGRIEPGAQADLVAFALDDLRDGVHDDPIRTLVLNGTARQVRHSVVAGRTVVRDGTLPGLDVDAMRRQGQTLFETMRAGYTERTAGHPSVETLFPPTFGPFPTSPTDPDDETRPR